MTLDAKGSPRYRARATTALATIALVAGGYLVMSGTTAKAESGVSVNETSKQDMLSAAPESSNEAGKQGKLSVPVANGNETAKQGKPIAAGANSNEVGKQSKAIAAGASSNEAGKQGKSIVAGANSNEVGKQGKAIQGVAGASSGDPQYEEKFGGDVTSSTTGQPATAETVNEAQKGSKLGLGDDTDYGFRPGPQYDKNYEADKNIDVYGAKKNVATARPLVEAGREQYTSGEFGQESSLFGEKNLLIPGLAIYGDWRTAVAYNQNNGNDIAQIATRVNIDVDLKLTGTERIHAFFQPLQDPDGAAFTRCEFGGGGVDKKKCKVEFEEEPQTLFFEGDLGSIYSGFSGKEATFDLPFTVGLFPLFLQNGIWANDAILGGAASLTAKNSKKLGLANYDVTFFTAFENVDNKQILGQNNNKDASLYGATTFIDAFGGYIEAGAASIYGEGLLGTDDQLTTFLTFSFTKRYFNTISNSTRFFANFGDGQDDEGYLVISENSLISGLPSTLLPYANFFVGAGNPAPLVDGNNAGLLKNVGINFQTDALTGFPKLNDTGSNAYGGAIGIQYLFNLDQQIVFEVATVQPFGDPILGISQEDAQYAVGVRYQIPLNKDWLFRADATYQIVEGLNGDNDNFGIRSELRRKF